MVAIIWKCFIAFISSLGFAWMFNMPNRWLIPSSTGGVVSWVVFLVCQKYLGPTIFLPCFIASVCSALYAFGLSRFSKSPFSMYFMIAVVPLIPGSGLYYTILNLAQANRYQTLHFARMTSEYALAIAFGVSVVWAGVEIHRRYRSAHKTK